MLDTNQTANAHVENVLRKELARDDKALSGVAPVLSHLLASSGFSLVSEAVVARLRGMLSDISRQILRAVSHASAATAPDEAAIDALADHLAADSAILSHLYATSMEWRFTERFETRHAIDPVLGPLLQELIGSEDARTAELAMNAMTAQSRFVQTQRRMELPLNELPAEHFLLLMRRSAAYLAEHTQVGSTAPLQALKRHYDESATRVGLFVRLVTSMGSGARAALELEHAGFALFATALGVLAKQPRELAVLGCHERQGARLALGLRAAGLDDRGIAQQFALVEPAERLPQGIGDLTPAQAQAILNHSPARAVG